MISNGVRVVAVLAALVVMGLTPAAYAKGKKKGGSSPPEQGGGMTFEPDVGQSPEEPPTKPPPTGKKHDGTVAAPAHVAPSGPGGPPTKTLERALQPYESDDYSMSSIELNKVIEGQSGDDESNKQRAEFYMGKALFNLNYYSSLRTYFAPM